MAKDKKPTYIPYGDAKLDPKSGKKIFVDFRRKKGGKTVVTSKEVVDENVNL